MLHMMFKIDPINFSERTQCGPKGGGQEARNSRRELLLFKNHCTVFIHQQIVVHMMAHRARQHDLF